MGSSFSRIYIKSPKKKSTDLSMEAPRGKQRGIFDPKGEKSIRIRASNPRPKGWGMRRAVRVQKAGPQSFQMGFDSSI